MKKSLSLFLILLLCASGLRAAYINGNPKTTAATVAVCTGTTTVDVPITAASLGSNASVGVISLELSYNTSQLSLDADTAKWLVSGSLNSTISSWGTFLIGDGGTPGNIIISAYQPGSSYSPLTLSDPGTVLFTLHFTIGTIATGTTAALTFYDGGQGTACEYDGAYPDYIPFTDTPTADYYIAGGASSGSVAAAGPDQDICASLVATMAANAPSVG